jgi:hypothetical protein
VTHSGKVVVGVSSHRAGLLPERRVHDLRRLGELDAHDACTCLQATVPADGFSGYHAFPPGNGVERWGDYGFAAVDGNSVWVANEWIPGLNQGPDLAGWGTYVSKVTP